MLFRNRTRSPRTTELIILKRNGVNRNAYNQRSVHFFWTLSIYVVTVSFEPYTTTPSVQNHHWSQTYTGKEQGDIVKSQHLQRLQKS